MAHSADIRQRNSTREFIFSILIVLSVSLICYPLSSLIGYKSVALILLMTVSIAAILFDIAPVFLAAFLSALIWDFFFIPPQFTLYIRSTEDGLMLAMYFVIAVVNAVLSYKIRQAERLARQKEMQARSISLYNVLLNSLSHELKTPIAMIQGATDSLLTDEEGLTKTNRIELMHEISKATERLNEQIENLLNMSRIGTGYLEPKLDWVDISELIYTVVNRLNDKLHNHNVSITIPENFPLFKLDSGLIETALMNLISNAAKYTPAGSAITITAGTTQEVRGHLDENYEDVSAKRDKLIKSLILEVSDNGEGFPEEQLDRVFDRFYRLKNTTKTGGVGLGLSIVKGFVEAHNGAVSVSINPRGGATFSMRIPAEVLTY